MPFDNLKLFEGLDPVARAARSREPQELFAAVDQYASQFLQHSLCTVNSYDPATQRVLRLYSSNPTAYPVGGSKEKAGTDWARQVLIEQRMFVGEDEASIRLSFDDFEAIRALGLQSVINVPVVARGICLGTINFLMQHPGIHAAQIQGAQLAALLATPGFMTVPTPEDGRSSS